MVDWDSPSVIATCSLAADRINMYTRGIQSWYILTTLHKVEIPLLTRRLRWRWTYLFYLGARYLLLASEIIGLINTDRLRVPILHVTAGLDGLVVFCSSGNLLSRTMAIWKGYRPILIALTLMGTGHLAVLVGVVLDTICQEDKNYGTTGLSHNALPFFIYSVIYDLCIMMLTVVGLLRYKPAQSSSLWRRLYHQGILYFAGTSILNLPLLIFTAISINSCVSNAFISPTVTLAGMASCMAVTSVLDLGQPLQKESQSTIDGSNATQDRILFTTVQPGLVSVMRPPEERTEQADTSQGLTSVEHIV